MKRRMIAALMMGLSVAACGGAPETVSRGMPLDMQQDVAPVSVSVRSVQVRVPRELEVSEANRYFPGGDIVWREDPFGDRHAQVQAIVQDAMQQGVAGLDGAVPVDLDIEVVRFHALTEKARYSTGGVHGLQFTMTLKDAASGQALTEPRLIKADLKAYGGQKAIAAMQRGETQKLRITRHLAEVIRTEIAAPGSYRPADLGMMALFD